MALFLPWEGFKRKARECISNDIVGAMLILNDGCKFFKKESQMKEVMGAEGTSLEINQ